MLICGIDEAGRGPMVGPMVMTGAAFDEKGAEQLKALGVKDSKLLSAKRREFLAEEIKKIAKVIHTIIVTPAEIDEAVESKTTNLNWLEGDKTSIILNKINPDKAYVDCPSNNTHAYRCYLQDRLEKKNIQLHVEHKADEKYVEASAASIISKVLRDREIEKIKEKLKMDFGSGYPADEKTQKFLKENWKKFPDVFRKSWASYKKVADEKQSKLGHF